MVTYKPEKSWQNIPDPEMDSSNPFVNARNYANMTQTQVAKEIGITPLKIMRLEQATLSPVPNAVVAYYRLKLKLGNNWDTEYQSFRVSMRRCAPRPIYGTPQFPRGPINFRRWRQYNWPGLSQIGWAKAFCVNPGSVHRLEMEDTIGIVTQEMMEALQDAGIFNLTGVEKFARTIRAASDNR